MPVSPQVVKVPTSKIESSTATSMQVDSVAMQNLSVRRINLTKLAGSFAFGKSEIKDFKVRFTVKLKVEWWVGVTIDFWFDSYTFSWSGDFELGPFTSSWIDLGDQTINWGQMNMNIPSVSFGPLNLAVSPIQGVKSGQIQMVPVVMEDTEVPTGLLALLGITIPVPNPMKPTTTQTEQVLIERAQAAQISVPNFLVPQTIQIPNLKMDDMTTGQIQSQGSSTKYFSKSIGPLWLGVTAYVTTDVKIGSMTLRDIKGSMSVGSFAAEGISFDLAMQGVRVVDLVVKKASAPKILVKV